MSCSSVGQHRRRVQLLIELPNDTIRNICDVLLDDHNPAREDLGVGVHMSMTCKALKAALYCFIDRLHAAGLPFFMSSMRFDTSLMRNLTLEGALNAMSRSWVLPVTRGVHVGVATDEARLIKVVRQSLHEQLINLNILYTSMASRDMFANELGFVRWRTCLALNQLLISAVRIVEIIDVHSTYLARVMSS